MTFYQDGFGTIDEDECLQLLRSAAIGRIALSVRALPVVLPVNFALDTNAIVIRVGGATGLEQACDQAVVAFEADGLDPGTQTGWSVMVQGTASVLTSPVDLRQAREFGLTRSGNPQSDAYVKVALDLVTGCRLGDWRWAHGLPEGMH